MSGLPTGTVTFLFTDIENSTKLWGQYPEAMRAALARHDTILRQAIESHDGYVFKTAGDAFCAVFDTAYDALTAAIAGQVALQAESLLRVRMALHTGATEERDGDYFGPPLNRVARLLSTGHGGQILLSLATAELVRDDLPEEVSLRDLGQHRLKDLTRPEHVFQPIASGLPTDFPPLKSLDTFPNNLPIQLTSFIGREHEMAEIKRLLNTASLVTLTGSGGIGKTRLLLQVAADVLEGFVDGVWLVELAELAPLTDPAFAAQEVATVLNLRRESDRPLLTSLVDYLSTKQILLMLDNCEHLIDACTQLAEKLLKSCPKLRILASSRETLGITGERSFLVPPLSLPNEGRLPPIETLTQYEAVRLFIDRAVAALPSFAVTNHNAPAVAEICHRLDGIPLAIELAAARVRVLSVEQIKARLANRFQLLTGGGRTAMPRHQTLRATIDWSYDLLEEKEQSLFQRLSVFAGGWTLEAAEEVCISNGIEAYEVLDLLANLVDKSLVMVIEQSEEARYLMLETIRQYVIDKLKESQKLEQVKDRHLDFFLKLAVRAEQGLRGPDQKIWLECLKKENDNFRAALERILLQTENREMKIAIGSEEYNTLSLKISFANIYNQLGAIYGPSGKGEIDLAIEYQKQALGIRKKMGDVQGEADSYNALGLDYMMTGKLDEALKCCSKCMELKTQIGDTQGIGIAWNHIATVYSKMGEYDKAIEDYQKSVEIFERIGALDHAAAVYNNLGMIHQKKDEFEKAMEYYEMAMRTFDQIGATSKAAICAYNIGDTYCDRGELDKAQSFLDRALERFQKVGHAIGIARAYNSLGKASYKIGEAQKAVEYYLKGLEISENSNDTRGRGLAYYELARAYVKLNDINLAKDYLSRALEVFEGLKASPDIKKVKDLLAEIKLS